MNVVDIILSVESAKLQMWDVGKNPLKASREMVLERPGQGVPTSKFRDTILGGEGGPAGPLNA